MKRYYQYLQNNGVTKWWKKNKKGEKACGKSFILYFNFNHYRLLWIKINARICKFDNITVVSPFKCSTDISPPVKYAVNCSTPNTESPLTPDENFNYCPTNINLQSHDFNEENTIAIIENNGIFKKLWTMEPRFFTFISIINTITKYFKFSSICWAAIHDYIGTVWRVD